MPEQTIDGADETTQDVSVETDSQDFEDQSQAGETSTEEASEDDSQVEDNSEDGSQQTDSTDEENQADSTDAQSESEAEAQRKQFNNEQAQRRMAEKKALQSMADQYVEKAKEAVSEAEDADDATAQRLAEIEYRDAQREAQEFMRGVDYNQRVMTNDHARAANEISMFREFNADGSRNPEFNQAAYDRALTHLAPHLQTQQYQDENGETQSIITGANVSVYDFLKAEADALETMFTGIRSKASLQGQQAERKMRAASEPGNSGTPPAQSDADDTGLSADAYARKYNLGSVR